MKTESLGANLWHSEINLLESPIPYQRFASDKITFEKCRYQIFNLQDLASTPVPKYTAFFVRLIESQIRFQIKNLWECTKATVSLLHCALHYNQPTSSVSHFSVFEFFFFFVNNNYDCQWQYFLGWSQCVRSTNWPLIGTFGEKGQYNMTKENMLKVVCEKYYAGIW